MTRVELAASTTAPVWDYDYAYTLPTDCLRVWRVDAHPESKWKVEAGAILTDLTAPLNILYIKQVTNTALFTAGFSFALSMRLAAELAMPLTQKESMFEAMHKAAEDAVRRARSQDAMEGSPDQVYADVFLEARMGRSWPTSWYRG